MSVKILFIDDDPDDHMILMDAMESFGYLDILQVSSNWIDGQKTLLSAFKSGQLPCLIILDLNMPLKNGSEILALLKNDKRFESIPVIIYSTSINNHEKQKCMKLGAHDYITKPVSYEESLATAQSFLTLCNL